MARLTRIAGSFALVLVAYWAYGVAALPWIEPPAVPEQRSGGAQGQDLDAWRRDSEDDRLKALAPFSAPKNGNSNRRRPTFSKAPRQNCSFESATPSRAADYSLSRARSFSCPSTPQAITRNGSAGPSCSERRAWRWTRSNPDQFNVRRLRNGRLVGPVTLRSTVKTAEGDQELRVVGSDVNLTEEGIWTPNDVNFRLGPSFGRGAR